MTDAAVGAYFINTQRNSIGMRDHNAMPEKKHGWFTHAGQPELILD
jgi:hypothetical protein